MDLPDTVDRASGGYLPSSVKLIRIGIESAILVIIDLVPQGLNNLRALLTERMR